MVSYLKEVGAAKEATASTPATGPEYQSVVVKDGVNPSLEGVTTLYELFNRSVVKFADCPCLGKRTVKDNGEPGEYTWITYKEAGEQVAAVASALKAAGLAKTGRVGVYGANSPEWMVALQACNRMTYYCVPLYDTLGDNAVDYIVKHSETTAVFVSTEKIVVLVSALKASEGQVKTVVYWGPGDAAAVEAIKALGTAVYSFEEFIALGKANPAEPEPPSPSDLCTIMYTSGTTGDPKGVMLRHDGVVSTVAGAFAHEEELMGLKWDHNEVLLSFLPLAHIYDRVTEEQILTIGGRIGYWRGSVTGLMDDIAALKPTIFIAVPRVFDRIYTGVMSKIEAAGGLKKVLFNFGFGRKLGRLNRGVQYDKASPIFDALVFSKVKERLGGRVKLIISGGAPLARHVEDFLKVTMCAPVVQGYGLTETCAASFVSLPDTPALAGTVGPVLPPLTVRLEAVPDMNADPMANPPRGEVCVKGPSVFAGYYKDQEKTDEVLDKDGWFHTGDIGEFTPEGALRIIDRKKNIFKLSHGEYVAVEKLEAVYKKNPLVEQVWVYGNSFESTLIAVVVPVEATLMGWAKLNGVAGDFKTVCGSEAANKYVLDELTKTGKDGKLKGFEIVKSLHLEPTPFGMEEDLLTPTFKLKRPQLQRKYQAQIDALYAAVKAAPAVTKQPAKVVEPAPVVSGAQAVPTSA